MENKETMLSNALVKYRGSDTGNKVIEDIFDKRVYRSLKILGINQGYDSLSKLKLEAKKNFRKIIFSLHPDTTQGYKHSWKISAVKNAKKYIMKLKTLPMTLENLDRVLEIRKGYTNYNDLDLDFIPYFKELPKFISYNTIEA